MNILILEDEVPAYEKLVAHLTDYFSEEVSHDWSRSISKGKVLIKNNIYDLVLSDIQLLDGLSFDIFDKTDTKYPIIFCSAHDEYLLDAFNTNGIAYILKPYAKKEFSAALKKYEVLFRQGNYTSLNSSIVDSLKQALSEEQNSYKNRFVIKKSDGIKLLKTSNISVIISSGDFCIAIDYKNKRHTISESIGRIDEQLPPKKFFRVNRSQIVNIDYIVKIENHFKNRLIISITGCDEKIMTSSPRTTEFRTWLET
ncbi:response regulator transcription factor [bacterium AH-315-A23]|nr:response regulator transcription factor [bacterium AH-315-A23]